MSDSNKYFAFISYSHADSATARWLHRKLEAYRVPSALHGRTTKRGSVPARLGRCFRDEAELSAASGLSESLQEALRQSQSLIVICSPRSAASRWVNEEIRYFRSLGRHNAIFALITDGQPGADDPAQECFPEALLRDVDGTALKEPLAADLRKGQGGRTDAFVKLVAGLLGLGLDDLRRREHARKQRFATAMALASLLLTAIMGSMALSERSAREEAQRQRAQADDLIGFMLGDLRENLEGVGRLDVLDQTVNKTTEYLQRADASDSTASLQRAAAYTAIAYIHHQRGQLEQADASARLALSAARLIPESDPGRQEHLAMAVSALAFQRSLSAQFDEAKDLIAEGMRLIEDGSDKNPPSVSPYTTASMFSNAGYYFSSREPPDYDQALAMYLRCADALTNAQKGSHQATRIGCRLGAGIVEFIATRKTDQLKILIEESDGLLHEFGKRADVMYVLLGALGSATTAFIRTNQTALASQTAEKAVQLGRRLLTLDSSNQEWQLEYASALSSSIETRVHAERWPEAMELIAEGLAVTKRGTELDPTQVFWSFRLKGSHLMRVIVMIASSESRAAINAAIDEGLAAPFTDTRVGGLSRHTELLGWKWVFNRSEPELEKKLRDEFLRSYAKTQSGSPPRAEDLLYQMNAIIAEDPESLRETLAVFGGKTSWALGQKQFFDFYCRRPQGQAADVCTAHSDKKLGPIN